MTRNPDLDTLSAALGSPVSQAAPLPVGFGLRGYRVHLQDGRELAVKAGAPPIPNQLRIEGHMLDELGRLSKLPVPKVHYCDEALLAMDWVNANGGIGRAHQRHMAELLAELHSVKRPYFGFESDTVIATLPQPNTPSELWVPFYRDRRVLFLAELAVSRNLLPARLAGRIEKLALRFDELIGEPAHPALIHGDIWSGNVLCGRGRIEALIDPAIYYAHPEIELAFMTMFGSFGTEFFDAYAALTGLETQGFFSVRKDIYLLYPLLVHVLVCSPSYVSGIERILDKFSA